MEVPGTENIWIAAFKRPVPLHERAGCHTTASGKILVFLHLFYYKHSHFTETKILQIQGRRVSCFYLRVSYFSRSKQNLAVRTTLTLQHHSGTQPASRCACPSWRCQLVWHLQKCSQAAHGHPVSADAECGQGWAVLTESQPLSFSEVLCHAARLGLCVTEYISSAGWVWSIHWKAAEIQAPRPNMEPELPTFFPAGSMS